MKKVLIAILAILVMPTALFAANAGQIMYQATLAKLSTATSEAFTLPDGVKEVGLLVTVTGSHNTDLTILGCTTGGTCVADNSSNADTYTTVATTETAKTTSGIHADNTTYNDNITTTIVTTFTTNKLTTGATNAYFRENLSAHGGTGKDGKYFFKVPASAFPPASSYKIKAVEADNATSTITIEVNYR